MKTQTSEKWIPSNDKNSVLVIFLFRQVSLLEGQVGEYEDLKREHENRSFELANLLEILKRFDVDVGSVCQLGAEGKYYPPLSDISHPL